MQRYTFLTSDMTIVLHAETLAGAWQQAEEQVINESDDVQASLHWIGWDEYPTEVEHSALDRLGYDVGM
jgi:hypothetical protein